MRVTEQPDTVARCIDAFGSWLSEAQLRPGVPVSQQLREAAESGCLQAKALIDRGFLDPVEPVALPAPTPAPSVPNVIARERKLATQTLPIGRGLNRKLPTPRRPSVHRA